MAKICAISIQHWLKSAVENQAVFQNEDTCKTLQAANIAVLVRDKNEAALVKMNCKNWGSRQFIFLIKIAYLIAMLRKN